MTISQWSTRLLAASFVLVIFLPLLSQRFSLLEPQIEVTENRTLAERPQLSRAELTEYPEAYENYFNDHFGFRESLIRLNSWTKYKWFHSSTVSEVIPGDDGWLFFAGGTPQLGLPVANHLGVLPDFAPAMFDYFQNRLEFTQAVFANLGIDYLYVVAPDKWNIYPEHLPAAYDAQGRRPVVQQFVEHMRQNSSVPILDLRNVLEAGKNQDWPVFLKGDTHWSDLGAFAASAAIINTVAQDYPTTRPLLRDQYQATEFTATELDLVQMLGLDGLLTEKTVRLTRLEPSGVNIVTEEGPGRHLVVASQNDPTLPRALVLRDSYGDALVPFLSEGFSQIEYLWTIDAKQTGLKRAIKEVQPDIVIEIRVERFALHKSKYYVPPEDEILIR